MKARLRNTGVQYIAYLHFLCSLTVLSLVSLSVYASFFGIKPKDGKEVKTLVMMAPVVSRMYDLLSLLLLFFLLLLKSLSIFDPRHLGLACQCMPVCLPSASASMSVSGPYGSIYMLQVWACDYFDLLAVLHYKELRR